MIWLIFALLTGLAVFSILWPLSRPAPADAEHAVDIAFYRAQIAEIDADVQRGLVDPAGAEAAKALAARRLLALGPEEMASAAPTLRARRIAAILALLAIPAVALGLYTRIGHPELPDAPLEARLRENTGQMNIEMAVAKIEKHLALHPDDGRGYELVAPIYQRMGRLDDAVRARAEALRLLGPTAQRHASYADAIIEAANGVVTSDASAQLALAAALDPKLPEARYYLGLAAAQDGDKARAKEIWASLAAETPAGSPIKAALEQKIAELDGKQPDEAKIAPPPADAAASVAAMPSDEQQKTIHMMVDRLAQRLATQGGDAENWMRLIRAYKVLNEQDKARAALGDARKALKDDPAGLAKLGGLAHDLGLDG